MVFVPAHERQEASSKQQRRRRELLQAGRVAANDEASLLPLSSGNPMRPECARSSPNYPTFGRRDRIVSVYIIILLLSIKRFHAAIPQKPPLWRASGSLQIAVVYNPGWLRGVYGHPRHGDRAERIRQVGDYAQHAHRKVDNLVFSKDIPERKSENSRVFTGDLNGGPGWI